MHIKTKRENKSVDFLLKYLNDKMIPLRQSRTFSIHENLGPLGKISVLLQRKDNQHNHGLKETEDMVLGSKADS